MRGCPVRRGAALRVTRSRRMPTCDCIPHSDFVCRGDVAGSTVPTRVSPRELSLARPVVEVKATATALTKRGRPMVWAFSDFACNHLRRTARHAHPAATGGAESGGTEISQLALSGRPIGKFRRRGLDCEIRNEVSEPHMSSMFPCKTDRSQECQLAMYASATWKNSRRPPGRCQFPIGRVGTPNRDADRTLRPRGPARRLPERGAGARLDRPRRPAGSVSGCRSPGR